MGLAAELTQQKTELVNVKKYQSKGQCMWGMKQKERQPLKNKNQKKKTRNEQKEIWGIVNKFHVCVMYVSLARASQVALVVKNPPANAGDRRDAGSIPGSGRSPGEGNGNPLWYPCLENPMDRGAWRATVHRVTKSQTQLSVHVYACTHTHTHTGKPDRPKGDGSFLGSRGLWFQAVDTFLKPYIYVYIFSKLWNL